jgi:hypothetical protein
MTKKRTIAWVAGGIALALAGVAVAANLTSSHQSDFASAGKHQFYVWCVGGRDFTAYQDGASAEAAQTALYEREKAEGHDRCWPVWQGRVAS